MKAIDCLRAVADYPKWSRGRGHTALMLVGVDKFPGGALILVAHQQERRNLLRTALDLGIKIDQGDVLTLDDVPEKLRYRPMLPLIVDHAAWSMLVDAAVHEMQEIVSIAQQEAAGRRGP